MLWTTSISGRGTKLLLLQLFWVQLPSPPGWTPRSCCRPLSWGWAAEPTFWPAEERTRVPTSRPDDRYLWWWRLQLTVLHFSISVLISGLTFSIRSTRVALLFIIPPGMTKTLVPPTDETDSGWWTLGSSRRHYECTVETTVLTHVCPSSIFQLSLFGILLWNTIKYHTSALEHKYI